MERDRVTKENAEEKLRLERRIAKEKAEKAEQEELDRQRRCAENARYQCDKDRFRCRDIGNGGVGRCIEEHS